MGFLNPALKTLMVRKYLNFENSNYPKMLVLKGDHQSGEILALDCYEKVFIDFFKKNMKFICPDSENKIMLDIGASYGTYCLNFSPFFKKLIAFEPAKVSFTILNSNIKINNLQNIISENVGLSDFDGTANIVVPKGDNGSAFILKNNKNIDLINNNLYEVDVKSLDLYVKNNLKDVKIGLIKIDAEGLEPDILKASKDTIIQNLPVILFESHGAKQLVKVINILQEFGYYNFYKLTQSRRLWKNKMFNYIEFLFRPNFLKVNEIKDIKDENYQVVIACVNKINLEKTQL